MEESEFTSSMCLKLLEICLKQLTFWEHTKVNCLLIKLLLTSIQRQVGRSDGEERETKEENLIKKLLKLLKSSLRIALPPSMSNYYKSDILLRELEVCRTN